MKILIASDVDQEAIDILSAAHDVEVALGLEGSELAEKARPFEALVVRSKPKVTKEVIDAAKDLKIVARAGVGLDNIDMDACKARGIKVINSPTALSESVAELVFAMILSFDRNIVQADNSMKAGLWEKNKFKGTEVCGKTMGIVGFGRIGSHIAKIANGYGMEVFAYDVKWDEGTASEFGVSYKELDELLRTSDYITLHVPLIPPTRGMISKKQLAMMKDNALLINTSRGGVVNEDDLFEALRDGVIRGACLDVFESEPPKDSPLLGLDNVILTPHLGASTEEAQKKAGIIIAKKIMDDV